MMTAERTGRHLTVTVNKKARHDYIIEETYLAGLCLLGTEVKSLRAGQVNLVDSYAAMRGKQMVLMNAHIGSYTHAPKERNHDTRRPRPLLLQKREMKRLAGAVTRKGLTLIPLAIEFDKNGIAKLQLGLGRGRKKIDKREMLKERAWKRDQSRLVRRRQKGDS